jgi:hypothetical protein
MTLNKPILVSWVITTSGFIVIYKRFGETYYLHLQGCFMLMRNVASYYEKTYGESCTGSSYINYTHLQILLHRANEGERDGRDMRHALERRGKCSWFGWQRQKDRDHSEDQGAMGSEWILVRLDRGV